MAGRARPTAGLGDAAHRALALSESTCRSDRTGSEQLWTMIDRPRPRTASSSPQATSTPRFLRSRISNPADRRSSRKTHEMYRESTCASMTSYGFSSVFHRCFTTSPSATTQRRRSATTSTIRCSIARWLFLHLMLRELRPSRIVEVGSGYSSACMLDTIELSATAHELLLSWTRTPSTLRSLLRTEDESALSIVESPVQNWRHQRYSPNSAPAIFLFIDSTHVVKAGSDVNYLFFDVLPSLGPAS